MERYGLIGNPIAHSKSPKLFAAAYSGALPYDLIEADTFEQAWRKFVEGPYRAINITAPFKTDAANACDSRSEEVGAIGAANIAVKTPEGIVAHNSDYTGVKLLLAGMPVRKAVVVGFGGAGRAAYQACVDLGFDTSVVRHNEVGEGIIADLVVYTLPRAVAGIEKIDCRVLLEANYKDPACAGLPLVDSYIPGSKWLQAQAYTGFEILTGTPCEFEKIAGVEL